MHEDVFPGWFEALQKRHLEKLKFPEVRRAVQALSSLYVERRTRLDGGAPFAGAGKRAAFAMYFGPLHFLLVREIVRALEARVPKGAEILDLGCGTGVAGAAWALEQEPQPKVLGVDQRPWAIHECKWTYDQLGIRGVARNGDIKTLRISGGTAVIAAFTINELDHPSRERVRDEFIKVSRSGAPVLVIEPVARRIATWWDEWATEWRALGGREDHWHFRVTLPEQLALMDKAAGLDHRELKGRSLWLPPVA